MQTEKDLLCMLGDQTELNSVFLKVDLKEEWFFLQIFSPFQTNLFSSTPVI